MSLELEKKPTAPIADVVVKAYKSHLQDGAVSFGRVQAMSKRVSTSNLIALIAERNPGIEPAIISYVASLLHNESVKQLREGKRVEVLGLGTCYIATKGAIKGDKPSASDIPKIVLKFKGANDIKTKIKTINASMVIPVEVKPEISIIEDMKTKVKNGTLKEGTIVKVVGKRLRIEGDKPDVGLYILRGGASKIKVDMANIIRNEPSTLEFILPSVLKKPEEITLQITNQGRVFKGFAKSTRTGVSGFSLKIEV